jgi:hypothetical protein
LTGAGVGFTSVAKSPGHPASTRLVGDTGTIVESVANLGHFAVTLRGPASGGGFDPVTQVRFAIYGPSDPIGSIPSDREKPTIRLKPGATAAVFVTIVRDRCARWQAGSGYSVDSVGLRVSQLGLTTRVRFPLARSYGVYYPTTQQGGGPGC